MADIRQFHLPRMVAVQLSVPARSRIRETSQYVVRVEQRFEKIYTRGRHVRDGGDAEGVRSLSSRFQRDLD